jgi:predicted nucleic acid-binding protein
VIVIDASVWISHLVPRDARHEASRRWLTEVIHSGATIVAPDLLLAEVAGAMARRTGDAELGHKAVAHILTTPNLRMVYSDEELGLLAARLAADRRLRGADAAYVAVAYQLGVPLVTWDQEQLARAGAVIGARMPEQAE